MTSERTVGLETPGELTFVVSSLEDTQPESIGDKELSGELLVGGLSLSYVEKRVSSSGSTST